MNYCITLVNSVVNELLNECVLSLLQTKQSNIHTKCENFFFDHAVCIKLEIHALTLTKYINLQAECFMFTIMGNENYLQFQQFTVINRQTICG